MSIIVWQRLLKEVDVIILVILSGRSCSEEVHEGGVERRGWDTATRSALK